MKDITAQNREYLRLLSIFHYVVGGIVAAFSLFTWIYIGLGLTFILAPQQFAEADGGAPPPGFGWIFLILGVVGFLFCLILATCLVISGRSLAKRKRYWFSFVVACAECIFTPFGTVLGIFTVVVLSKESVKALYGLNSAP